MSSASNSITKKIIKWFTLTLLALVLIIGASFAALVTFVNPNDYKQDIQTSIANNTDFTVQLDGDLAWSIYPNLGIKIGSGSATFKHDAKAKIADWEQVRVSVAVKPLLQKRIEVKTVAVQKLHADIKQSVLNQLSKKDTAAKQDTQKTDKPTVQATTNNEQPFAFVAEKIEIIDSSVRYSDDTVKNNKPIVIEGINTQIDNFEIGKTARIAVALVAKIPEQPVVYLDATTNFTANKALDNFAVSNLVLDVKTPKNKYVNNQDIALNVTGSAKADLAKNTATAGLAVNLNDGLAKLNTQVQSHTTAPFNATVTLKGEQVNLSDVFALLGITNPTPNGLKTFTLNKLTAFYGKNARINELVATLDNTAITASAKTLLTTPQLQLKVDTLTVEDYVDLKTKEETTTKNTDSQDTNNEETSTSDNSDLLPIDVLQQNAFNAQVDIKNVRINKSEPIVASLNVSNNGKKLRINNFSANLFEGDIQAQAAVNLQKQAPTNINLAVNNINIVKVIKHLADLDVLKSGMLNAKVQANTNLQTVTTAMHNLTGNGSVNMKNGAFEMVDADQLMCLAQETIKQKSLSPNIKFATTTNFKQVDLAWKATNGSVTLAPVVFSTENLAARIKSGNVNLRNKTLNIPLRISAQTDFARCELDNNVKNAVIPLICSGNWDADPASLCTLDKSFFVDIAKQKAKAEINRQKAKLKKKIDEKIQSELQKLTGGNGSEPTGDAIEDAKKQLINEAGKEAANLLKSFF